LNRLAWAFSRHNDVALAKKGSLSAAIFVVGRDFSADQINRYEVAGTVEWPC
jgi:hypothetical protein